MGKNTIIGTVLGLIAGLVIGFSGANYLNRAESVDAGPSAHSNPIPGGQPGFPQQGQMMGDVQETLDNAKNKPDDVDAQLKAGDMYWQIQRLDEALGFYQKAVDASPKSFAANYNVGKVYMEKRQFEKAGEFFTKALSIDSNSADTRSDLGLTYYLRDPADEKRAIAEYRKALEIDPNHEATLQNLSVALKDTGDTAGLNATLQKLEKVNPQNPAIEKLRGN